MINKLIFTLIGLAIFSVFIYGGATMQLNGERTDCYDNKNNQITDTSCTVTSSFDSRPVAYLWMGFIGLTMFACFYLLGQTLDDWNALIKESHLI